MAPKIRARRRNAWTSTSALVRDGDGRPLAAPHLVLRHRPTLEREVARSEVGAVLDQLGGVDVAFAVDEPWAPWMEVAGLRRVDRTGNVALQDDLLSRSSLPRVGD